MMLKMENNEIVSFYRYLLSALKMKKQNDYSAFTDMDPIIISVLQNNLCKFDPNNKPKQLDFILKEDEYIVTFTTNCIGNDTLEFYDFIHMNGTDIFVIFLDYFNIKQNVPEGDDPASILARQMGNSVYYDAIKKLVEIFYVTTCNISNILQGSVLMNALRWNKAIVAIHILNMFKRVDENDVSDMSVDTINEILSKGIDLQLYGIR